MSRWRLRKLSTSSKSDRTGALATLNGFRRGQGSRHHAEIPSKLVREVNPWRLAPKLGVADEDSDLGLWQALNAGLAHKIGKTAVASRHRDVLHQVVERRQRVRLAAAELAARCCRCGRRAGAARSRHVRETHV